MPVVDSSSSTNSSPSKLTVSQIIELANKRTERRGEKTLDLKAELLGVIQSFVQDHRWYWRRKSAIVVTEVGTPIYELTDPNGAAISDFEQMVQAGPKIFDASGTLLGVLTAEHDPDQQDICTEDTTLGTPAKYWVSGSEAELNVWPRPDAAYRIRIPYWANPWSLEGDDVPLVPAIFHMILVKGLEAQILRYTLGEGAGKYMAAKAEFEAALSAASAKEGFAPGQLTEWRNQDSQDAVQS